METVEVGCTEGSKKKRKKRQHFVLDFENPLELDMSKFEPPENPNSTLLVHRGGSCSSLLPPDLHYEALNLVTLFLKPTVQVSLSPSLSCSNINQLVPKLLTWLFVVSFGCFMEAFIQVEKHGGIIVAILKNVNSTSKEQDPPVKQAKSRWIRA
jgi:hypothetical protein